MMKEHMLKLRIVALERSTFGLWMQMDARYVHCLSCLSDGIVQYRQIIPGLHLVSVIRP